MNLEAPATVRVLILDRDPETRRVYEEAFRAFESDPACATSRPMTFDWETASHIEDMMERFHAAADEQRPCDLVFLDVDALSNLADAEVASTIGTVVEHAHAVLVSDLLTVVAQRFANHVPLDRLCHLRRPLAPAKIQNVAAVLGAKALAERTPSSDSAKGTMGAAMTVDEEDYRSFAENLRGIAYRVDADGHPLFIQGALDRIAGYTHEELMAQGRPLGALVHPDDKPEYVATRTSLLEQAGLETELEYRLIRRDGQIKWVADVAHSVAGPDGGACAIEGLIRDIDDSKRAQRELLRIRAALEDTTSAICMTDADLAITYLNIAFGTTFGYSPSAKEQVNVHALWADPALSETTISSILEGECVEGEMQMRDRDGRMFPAMFRGTPVLDDQFSIVGILFVIDDVTSQRQLETQLMQSQNMKSIGQLAAGVAHEINTPTQYVGDNTRFLKDAFDDLLRIIKTCRECLDSAGALPGMAEHAEAVKAVIEEVDLPYLEEEVPLAVEQALEGIARVSHIVRAMRELTHPGTGEKTLANVNKSIESAVTVSQNEWRYAAELEMNFDDNLPPVPCFPSEINQVFLNLIVNAAHAITDAAGNDSGEKGKITITTCLAGGMAEIRIADTGTGIPPEIRDQIFTPFFTTKTVGKGTGQGLAISYAVVVEKHGGDLSFETETGAGTTFIIRLPLHSEQSGEGA